MSLKCPIPYASQSGDPKPSGHNMQMNSNKQICVLCTIWPSDTHVVDLPCLGRGSALDDVSLLPGEDGCVGHITWVSVSCLLQGSPRGQWVLGAFKSSNSSFEVRPQGLVPVLRTLSALQASHGISACRWLGGCRHMAP